MCQCSSLRISLKVSISPTLIENKCFFFQFILTKRAQFWSFFSFWWNSFGCSFLQERVHHSHGPQCHSQWSPVAQYLHHIQSLKVSDIKSKRETPLIVISLIGNCNRRIFGQSHLSVYIDGTLRSMVNIRIPPVNEVRTYYNIILSLLLKQARE